MARQLLVQAFNVFPVVVGTNPTPLVTSGGVTAYIEAFVLAVPSTAANSIFLGNQGVTITSGMELVPGEKFGPTLIGQRQLYELQFPLLKIAEALQCKLEQPYEVPYVVWDLTNIYAVAAAATTCFLLPFKAPYV